MSVTVEMVDMLPVGWLNDTWPEYKEAFAEINQQSVQRHLLTRGEFTEIMLNSRILKFVARNSEGKFCGMSVMTNHLDRWPLISEAYFEKHYPLEYKEHRIWYVGFIFSTNHSGGTRELATYKSLVEEMYPYVANSRGFSVEDYSVHNVRRRMPIVASAVLRRLNPTHAEQRLDAQSYWAHFFDWPKEESEDA